MFKKYKRKQQIITPDENNEDLILDDEYVANVLKETKELDDIKVKAHEKFYSPEKLWNKIQKVSKKAGAKAVYVVLILYFTLQKPEVPLKVKATIAGALGYFILPFDLLPDVALGVGYVDDLSVITAALIQVAMYVDDDIKKKAKAKLISWFGEEVDTSEVDMKL